MIKNTTVGNIAAFLLIYNMYGYPLQSFIPFILQINSTPINIGIRSGILLVSLFLIGFALLRRHVKLNMGFICMIIFWIIYSIRLIYDLEIKGIRFLEMNNFYVYSFAFGSCLFPAIAVYLNSKYINLQTCIKFSFWLILLSNLSLIFTQLYSSNWSLLQAFVNRANVLIEISGESISIVNGITISFYGQLLALMSILFVRFKIFKKPLSRIFLVATCFLGILNLLMGSSRGPILSFILLLIIVFFLKSKNKFNIVNFFKGWFKFGLISGISIMVFLQNFKIEELNIFIRLNEFFNNSIVGNVKEDRDYQWESAIAQFVDSPFLGDQFVNNFDNSYAHNLFLDVIMSVGFIGFVPFMMMFVYLIAKIRFSINRLMENPYFFFFSILFIAEFLLGLTSGGTFVAINFWLLTAFLLGYPKQLVKRLDNN